MRWPRRSSTRSPAPRRPARSATARCSCFRSTNRSASARARRARRPSERSRHPAPDRRRPRRGGSPAASTERARLRGSRRRGAQPREPHADAPRRRAPGAGAAAPADRARGRGGSGHGAQQPRALRGRPSSLAWLLEPATMRLWFAEDLAADLAQTLGAFESREARMNALRRFKYRHLLRISIRDLLGDADLSGTTEELSHLADACIAQALREAEATVREAYGAPIGGD